MAKIINIEIGQPIVYVDEHGNKIPGLINADVGGGKANLTIFPFGTEPKSKASVPHYNVDGARTGAHWKKSG